MATVPSTGKRKQGASKTRWRLVRKEPPLPQQREGPRAKRQRLLDEWAAEHPNWSNTEPCYRCHCYGCVYANFDETCTIDETGTVIFTWCKRHDPRLRCVTKGCVYKPVGGDVRCWRHSLRGKNGKGIHDGGPGGAPYFQSPVYAAWNLTSEANHVWCILLTHVGRTKTQPGDIPEGVEFDVFGNDLSKRRWPVVWPSIAELVCATRQSPNRVRESLRELESIGLMHRVEEGGGRRNNRYALFFKTRRTGDDSYEESVDGKMEP